jgi:uncharacterized delta-60 repeat protein
MRITLACAALGLALLLPGALKGASAGWLDPAFGRNGIVRPTFVGNDQPAGVAVQGEGKIVVAATAFRSSAQWSFAIARYLVDGRLDTSFGSAGKVLVDHGSATNGSATAIAVQPDGKIVVVGRARKQEPPFQSDLALVRLNPDGSLDSGFGQGGKVVTDVGASGTINALTLQADGKIVVAGSRANETQLDGVDILVARYSSEGSLDPTFDGDGWLVTQLRTTRAEFAYAVAVQRDGAIVVGGAGGFYGEPGISIFDAAVVRYRPDGALDASFGDRGQVLVDLSTNDWLADLLVQTDGKIVAAGTAGDWRASRPFRFALLRLTADGALDRTFGEGGKVVTGFARNPFDSAAALVRNPEGTLVVAGGHKARTGEARSNFALARYRANGALDARFGRGGLLQTDLGRDEQIVDIARQRDGKLVAVGSQVRGESWGSVLTRYLSTPRCVVPDVRHLRLRKARIALSGAGCGVGRVRRRPSRATPGVVIGQRPAAGAELPRGGKVNLVVSGR